MKRALLVLLSLAVLGTPALASEILPLGEIHPGMIGVGRTVFEGNKIEEFKVEILGVLPNVGPQQSMILARLEGGPLEKSGVIAGMSGSPVYIDGRLVGAVAFGFPFSKETIAGITPIDEMISATRTPPTTRAASARFTMPAGPVLPLDETALLEAFPKRIAALFEKPEALSAAGRPMTALPLPAIFSGFDTEAFSFAKGLFSNLGFSPMTGGGNGGFASGSLPELTPGSPVGISLIEGDLDISVSGTVTEVQKDRIYAFGHPFYNLGPTSFPMKKAFVYAVFPSLYQSFKITATGDPVGTLDQDRQTGVSGILGLAPVMIPVNVTFATSRGQERHYSFRMVDDELLSPVLSYVALLSILQSNERAYGTASVRLDARISLAGGEQVEVEDLFSHDQPAQQASSLVALPLAYLLANDFKKVDVEKIDVSVSSYETAHRATLERVVVDANEPLRAGSKAKLRLFLKTYRGESFSETMPLSIPESAAPGSYSLLVADAQTLTGIEQRELRQPFAPKSLDQVIRAINGLRRGDRIYARLLKRSEGAVVSGELLQSLPPSVLSVLRTGDQGSPVVPIASTTVWELDLPTAYAFSGARTLPLTVER